MPLRNRIEEIRHQRGLSRDALAKALNYTYIMIWRLEKGVTPVTDEKLCVIADVLEVEPRDLLRNAPTPSSHHRRGRQARCHKAARQAATVGVAPIT